MNLRDKQVAVIGAGIAGLAAADELARWGIRVALIEKGAFIGGHTVRFGCKAVDECVRCGACLAQERMQRVTGRERISIMTDTHLMAVQRSDRFELKYETRSLDAPVRSGALVADALLVATGFAAFDPSEKPYGYGKFANVITNLEAEGILRAEGLLTRPSDGQPPERIAFIQCVGSRDSRIGHPWCSKICCGAALRMARLMQHRRPETAVTFFYIDVQSFGRDFPVYYDQCRQNIEMVRAIPADIFETADRRLQVAFFDPVRRKSAAESFDMVVLSVGLTPSADHEALSTMLDRPLTPNGFFQGDGAFPAVPGVFTAGAALGPMSIAESIDSAGRAVSDMVRFLEGRLTA